ncbi:MAG: hypothetical protein AAF636_22555 [Pseudomonadota bacterium]
MTAAIDNTVLTLLLNPAAQPCPNPDTGKPADHLESRILSLLDDMSDRKETLIIPTPALAETLCCATPASQIIARLREFACLELVAFDQMSAIELSELIIGQKTDVKKIGSDATRPWQHLKMDLQIVAIAKAHGADRIITDDGPQSNFAKLAGLDVVHTWDIPLLGKYQHGDLFDEK